MEKNEMQKKIRENPDFIHAPKCQNSLVRFLAKTEKPLENNTIARLLLMTPDEVEALYQESIIELRKQMKAED